MDKKTSKILLSAAVTVLVSLALAATWWLLLVYLYNSAAFVWIVIIATAAASCTTYWFAIMKWRRGEVLPFMRYVRIIVCTLIQIIFLAVAEKIYFRSHPIDRYERFTSLIYCWFLIAPLAQYILTELTFRQLHRLRVRLMQMRLYTRMLRNQIKK